ncbi:T9SS type A sorting domain-containing protein [Aquimarina sp. MMG016]|nr:T9SS type A sorting domain-containing protein [Aquimarina sp. MMG016]
MAVDTVVLTDGGSTGGGSTDICAGVPAYDSTQNYQPGDKVTFQGTLYERTVSGWNNLGACGTTTTSQEVSVDLLGSPVPFSVYPNPAVGILNVRTANSGTKPYLILNMLGQRVKQGKFTNTINVSELEGGVYMLNVGDQFQRFIKE